MNKYPPFPMQGIDSVDLNFTHQAMLGGSTYVTSAATPQVPWHSSSATLPSPIVDRSVPYDNFSRSVGLDTNITSNLWSPSFQRPQEYEMNFHNRNQNMSAAPLLSHPTPQPYSMPNIAIPASRQEGLESENLNPFPYAFHAEGDPSTQLHSNLPQIAPGTPAPMFKQGMKFKAVRHNFGRQGLLSLPTFSEATHVSKWANPSRDMVRRFNGPMFREGHFIGNGCTQIIGLLSEGLRKLLAMLSEFNPLKSDENEESDCMNLTGAGSAVASRLQGSEASLGGQPPWDYASGFMTSPPMYHDVRNQYLTMQGIRTPQNMMSEQSEDAIANEVKRAICQWH